MTKLMTRRRFLTSAAILTGFLAAPWLAGCGRSRQLQVALHPWVGYETLRLARELRWLPASVNLSETASLNESSAALFDGKVDAACLTMDEVLRLHQAGLPLRVGLVFDVSAGADVVLARPPIRQLSDLAGKRIGVEPGALGSLILQKLLAAAGIPAASVAVVDCPTSRQVEAWRRREIDVVISYEPVSSLLLREGARPIFDSRALPELIFDVLAVRGDRFAAQADHLRALVAAHFDGLGHLQRNREDALHRIAGYQGVPPEDVRRALGGMLLPTLRANWNYLSGADSRLLHAAEELSAISGRQVPQRDRSMRALFSTAWLPSE